MDPRNKKKQWGVVMGAPTSLHPYKGKALATVAKQHFGIWMAAVNLIASSSFETKPCLFFSRQEAENFAKECHRINDKWNYHAKKYNARVKNEPQ